MHWSRSYLSAFVLLCAVAVFAPAAMGQPSPEQPAESKTAPLSSAEVSDAEIESAAEIVVSMEVQRKKIGKKYGDPDDMTAEQRRKAQHEIVRERQALMQKKTVEEDMDGGRLELIMVSARRDSALHKRVQAALEKKRAEKGVSAQ
ncbi:MAG: hypothetical protein BRD55_10205 [Bacteroidetes bacterium SW_9_63_38]|nr:MAG: hypothetical protein BRD55_10205 [Bacteroidetes bacterium SW_9_63_38]